MFSPISAMLLLCFCLRAAKVPSWAMLDSSNSACSFQLLAKILNVPGQQGTVLLSLGTVGPLNVQLLIKLFEPALELLDLPAVLASQGLLVFNLGAHGAQLLFLTLNSLVELALDALQVSNSLLGELQVAFNLALDLHNITLGLLLTLQAILTLIQALLQLAFDLVQVVALVLHGLDIFLGLLIFFTSLKGTLHNLDFSIESGSILLNL